jgi:hypothetical protein
LHTNRKPGGILRIKSDYAPASILKLSVNQLLTGYILRLGGSSLEHGASEEIEKEHEGIAKYTRDLSWNSRGFRWLEHGGAPNTVLMGSNSYIPFAHRGSSARPAHGVAHAIQKGIRVSQKVLLRREVTDINIPPALVLGPPRML